MDSISRALTLEINGRQVEALAHETLLEVAQREGIQIPRLCHKDGMEAVGNCRSCMVEIEGERVLAPSCCRQVAQGMKVRTDSARSVAAQKMVIELLLSDMPDAVYTRTNELDLWAQRLGVGKSRFSPTRAQPAADASHAAITVNLDACIQCTRCVRACRDAQVNDVIGLALRGEGAKIVFDQDDPMGNSTCVTCGECVQACPTGALAPARGIALGAPDRQVDSVCPYCGVGCQLTYNLKGNKILSVAGRDSPANHGRLCVKGRYGFDYAHHPQRLTRPLIRRPGVPKRADDTIDPACVMDVFREASWEEALACAGGTLARIRDTHGKYALAGFGSAKGSNEEAYLFQKLVRTGFGNNNVDHCTRLCHASSVAALLEGLGSGAVSNPVIDVTRAEVVFVIGANPTVNHPVAATWMKNAARAGTKLIVCDPRRTELARHAHSFLQFRPDTDVALLNAMMHVIIHENLVDHDFIASRTIGYNALARHVVDYSPEAMAPVCGIHADTIRDVARLYATSRASMILWGMGISQHIHGTDNARCLISLALMTGQIGRPGTGLHPLRGQNNVQGASDAGLIPMMLPDYQRVEDRRARVKFEQLWGVALDPKPGLTVVEIMDAIACGQIRGLYIMGENPAMSDPDANHARAALAALDHLVVQDIFPTETAFLADVILPACAFAEKTGTFTNTDRLVQLGRQAIDPPGEARQDLWIIQQIANRLGLSWNYGHVSEVFDEMRRTMPGMAGIAWERLERDGAVTSPCRHEGDPGQAVAFIDTFPRKSGRARFVPAGIISADERPDADYPMVLITGRQLEHWLTGSMTRRAAVLDAIEPDPVALVHPLDLERLNAKPGDVITVASRRGQVTLYARADDGSPPGAVFVPFCYYEAAINRLTNPALDPYAKIPEFKYCAVRVTLGGEVGKQGSFGAGEVLATMAQLAT
jgi:formate dehydrogenase major subunit